MNRRHGPWWEFRLDVSSRQQKTITAETVHGRCILSQAARQGLAVLMAMVQVVLKWQNSTAYQSHNYESFVFKFGKGDNFTRINNPAKLS